MWRKTKYSYQYWLESLISNTKAIAAADNAPNMMAFFKNSYLQYQSNGCRIERPWSKLHLAVLLIERVIRHVDPTAALDNRGDVHTDKAVVTDDCVRTCHALTEPIASTLERCVKKQYLLLK